jgi:hypothetical protein
MKPLEKTRMSLPKPSRAAKATLGVGLHRKTREMRTAFAFQIRGPTVITGRVALRAKRIHDLAMRLLDVADRRQHASTLAVRIAACGSALVLASACTRADAPPGARFRDSAGIIIVENPNPLTADSMSWTVDTVPRVRIGQTDGPDEYLFGNVAGAARLGDGRIVVADAQTSELRFFDSTGAFLEKVGRVGQGPGEFVNFSELFRSVGDSLIVTDHEGSRYHVLDSRGRYLRRYKLAIKDTVARDPYTSPTTHGTFGDGSFLIADFVKCPGGFRRVGICVDTGRFMRVTESGDRVASFGNHVYAREEVVITTQGQRTSVRAWLAPTFWAANGSRFYFADASTFEIRVYSKTGSLERIVRADYDQLAPPSPIPDPPLASNLAPTDPRIIAMREARKNATIPERLPAFMGFHVDRAGNMWVREYVPYWIQRNRATNRWWVFDSTGVARHTVLLPLIRETIPWLGGSYRGPEIGEHYILGSRFNSDGAEEIVMYELRKTPPQ